MNAAMVAKSGLPDEMKAAMIAELRKGKTYKCPCDDGAGSGTSGGGVYVCEGCDGDGYTAERVTVVVEKKRFVKANS